MNSKAGELDKYEEDSMHYIGWLHHATQGVGDLVRQMVDIWEPNPLQLYTLRVTLSDGRERLAVEVYMGWCTNYADLGVETRKRRLTTASLVLDWLFWDDKLTTAVDEAASKGMIHLVRDRVNMLTANMGFTRRHISVAEEHFANAFQLSNMIETVGIASMQQHREEAISKAEAHASRGSEEQAKKLKYEAAGWQHDLVKAHLLNFSLPPLTRPLFMKTIQVALHPDLQQQVPGVPQAECHKREHQGRQRCTRPGCKGNHVLLLPDGTVMLYFPHYKNEGKLQPNIHYQLNSQLSAVIRQYVLPTEGQAPGGSDWQLLTSTAPNVADRRFLLGQCRTLGQADRWKQMTDQNLVTTMWAVVLGAPTRVPKPMKSFEKERVVAKLEEMGLLGTLVHEKFQPFPPQKLRHMVANAAIVLMEIGVEKVTQLVQHKQKVEAVLDMVADAMLSGKSSLGHYTAAEGTHKMQAAAELLSLVRQYNKDPRCLASKTLQLTLVQPEG
jgi:hypothetical protein